MDLVRARAKAGPLPGLLLSLLFGAALLSLATFDAYWGEALPPPGAVAHVTLRTPDLTLSRAHDGQLELERLRVLVPRGTVLADPQTRQLLGEYLRGRHPPATGLLIGLGLLYLTAGLLFTSYLRNFGHRGNLMRTQIALCAVVVGFVALAKALLLLTPLSAFYVPLAMLALPIALYLDRQVAFATTVVTALLLGTLLPFDLTLSTVLLVQGFAAVLALRRAKRSRRATWWAGLASGAVSAAIYVAIEFLASGQLPSRAWHDLASSGVAGCVLGGLGGGVLAYFLADLIEFLLGNVPKDKLVELADLENPLLKKLAHDAPGTWAHSLAMANLAEMAANAIGANALLTRVGAYYHDVGKSLQPRYYIENLHSGEHSPHEELEPDASAEAIFAHCIEGVKMGRKAGIPEPIIDFMHMHHGDGLLEYFWAKNQEHGNPKGLSESAFRYPGLPPQTRETAILAVCDAVEAASRTLKQPASDKQVEALVQRIIFGKMRLGQFDQSGLSVADMRKIAVALGEALLNSFHARIEYPWQREEAAAATATASAASPKGSEPGAPATPPPGASGHQGDAAHPFRLDSADAPRVVQVEERRSGEYRPGPWLRK